ncbi:MAG: DUF6065 family protein [Methylococcaceae bacterium]
MKIKAYRLNNQAARLQSASAERGWVKENKAAYAELSLNSANSKGWELHCPYAFEATWNGGPDANDIEIRLDEPRADYPNFVQSHRGDGLLTLHTGYQFKTEGENGLWIRGPINRPKDCLYPLESIADTALLPCTVTMTWTFTRPNQTIRFEAGEPFCAIVPYPKSYGETLETEEVDFEEALAVYEQEFQQMAQSSAVQRIFADLGANEKDGSTERDFEKGSETGVAESIAQLADPPPVSCICPTYGRVELLEEAIASFLQQDYPGRKELIILNDFDLQTLEFEHSEVRIINIPQRFSSIGEKYNAAVAACAYDLIFVWHDDDIYLPHRLSFSIIHFDRKNQFFKADRAWFWNDGQLSGPEQNLFHGGSCWTRELFNQIKGYPPHLGNGYDVMFEQHCEKQALRSTDAYPVELEEIYTIYRWAGTGAYHFSSYGQHAQAYQEVAAHVRKQAEEGKIKQGQIKLNPHWKTDYCLLVEDYMDDHDSQELDEEDDVETAPFPPPFHELPPPQPMATDTVTNLFRGSHPRKISVVLPSANESVLLQRTVEQFQATLPPNSEIIVVDNGSTDGCADFLVERKQQGVSLIQTTECLGVVGARNRGLAEAQGEIVIFSDAHMDLPKRWWQPIVAALNEPNVGVVAPGIGQMGKINEGVAWGQRIAEPSLRVEWFTSEPDKPGPVPTLGGGFMAMRHETLIQAGPFDPGMPQWGGEDTELCVRYWLLGYEVWLVPDVKVMHYFRKINPNPAKAGILTHNTLRLALLHFNRERIERVVCALKDRPEFGQALALTADSDVWEKRDALAARRVRDDDWFFEKFKESCSV